MTRRSPPGVRSPIVAAVDARRKELGWTQKRLADECRSTQSHISALLAGRTEPTLIVAERMCIAVGLQLIAAYAGEGNRE